MTTLKDLEPNLWFADTEVFAYDNIWVFRKYGADESLVFVNDFQGVADFINTEQPILCGYNFRDYDQHILWATMSENCTNALLKEINDILIFSDSETKYTNLWEYQRMYDIQPNKDLCIVDLFHDIVPRRSLKFIEGNLGMSVYESKVDFDIERPLTREELDETVNYCCYDVEATAALYEHRRDYLQAKLTLCDICGEDYEPLLKHTNARILSEVFHAVKYDFDTEEVYEIPPEVDMSGIPECVKDYVSQVNCDVAMGNVDLGKLEFDFHGVPSVFGVGGIHSADEVPYIEETTEDRVLLIQDITSYYPSLVLQYNYLSRAIGYECKHLYQMFYDMRVKAKAEGDKQTANAAKLVLNTFYGATRDKYNKLYDPLKSLSICITGQLAIMDAVNCAMRNAPSARLIQLNTDGWVLSVNRDELPVVEQGVSLWEARTGFSVDTQHVKRIIQRDVNNYILETMDNKVKTKGSVVNLYGGGSFTSNSMTITHEAIVKYLLHGTPIEETINACEEPEKFQLVAKTGHTFDYTEWEDDLAGEHKVRLNKTNRIFATTDENKGMVYKVKVSEDGTVSRAKIPNCPEHAVVVNGSLSDCDILSIDKCWYVQYSNVKMKQFIDKAISYEGEIMNDELKQEALETEEKPTPKRKPRTTKKEEVKEEPKSLVEMILEKTPSNINEALFKLQVLMSGNSDAVKMDGFISNINYAYADTQQYKGLLAKCANECGLIFDMSVSNDIYRNRLVQGDEYIDAALNGQHFEAQAEIFNSLANATQAGVAKAQLQNRSKQIICEIDVDFEFTFFLTGETKTYHCAGLGVGTQANSLSIALTNAMRNFITNNFLLDNKGREGDDVASNFMDALAEKSKKAYVSPDKKEEIKTNIIEENKQSTQYATAVYVEGMYEALKAAADKDAAFAEKIKPVFERAYDANGKVVTQPDNDVYSVLKRAAASKLRLEAENIAEA